MFPWTVPDLADHPPMWFQAARIDLADPEPFPLDVTNVRVVRPR